GDLAENERGRTPVSGLPLVLDLPSGGFISMSISSILKYLGVPEPSGADRNDSHTSGEIETIRRIARSLEKMEPARARKIAGFAFILSRAANADLSISDEETGEMERQVIQWTGLPEEQA